MSQTQKIGGNYVYLRWDPDAERLVPEPDRPRIGYEKLTAVFESLQTLSAEPGAVMRFHPSRELQERMTGRVLMFSLQICIHGDAARQIREHLALLTGQGVTQLVGMSLRPERPTRSNLANAIQKQIQEYYG